MAEAATTETLTYLVKLVQESLEDCKDVWQAMDEQPKLMNLIEFSGTSRLVALDPSSVHEPSTGGEEEEKANAKFRKLITLHTRTSLLSDIYATAGYSHGRATQTLLQSLLGRTPNPLEDLGSLHRACIWENIILKTVLSSRGIDFTPSHDLLSSLLGSAATAVHDQSSSATPGDANTSSPSTTTNGPSSSTGAANGTPPANATNGPASTEPSTSANTPHVAAKKEEQPRDKNAKSLKHLVSQIPTALAPFFQCKHELSMRTNVPLTSSSQPSYDYSRRVGAAIPRRSRRSRRRQAPSQMFSSNTLNRSHSVRGDGVRERAAVTNRLV